MSVKAPASEMSYIDFCGGPEQAVESAYREGAAAQRMAWAKWYESLPESLQSAIQRHKQHVRYDATWHEDGSLTIKFEAAPIN